MQYYVSMEWKFGMGKVLLVGWRLFCLGFILLAIGVPATLAAASQVNISQGFSVHGSVVEGSLVSTDPGAADTVVPATLDQADNLVGVVVGSNESLLSVTSGSTQTQVATSGTAYALVSDINGSIKAGDRITASPLSGVGMKATATGRIVGAAQADFSSASNRQAVQVKDKSGATKTVQVGRILLLVNVSSYMGQTNNANSIIPVFIQNLSASIAGKQVSTMRIILAGMLLFIALIVSITLMYGAVRNSIISIGRNPLSQTAVGRGLFQVMGFVLIVLLVTLFSIYLILSR